MVGLTFLVRFPVIEDGKCWFMVVVMMVGDGGGWQEVFADDLGGLDVENLIGVLRT